MTNQPNTEDGNEFDNLKYDLMNITGGNYNDEQEQEMVDYIQSNYILKSDVEKMVYQIIGESKDVYGHIRPKGYLSTDLTEVYREKLRVEQRQLAKSMGFEEGEL